MPPIRPDPDVYRFLHHTSAEVRDTPDAGKLMRHVLRRTREFLAADQACVAVLDPAAGRVRLAHAQPSEALWDVARLEGLLRREPAALPETFAFRRLWRRGRPWGLLALERRSRPFQKADRLALELIAGELSELVHRHDRTRLAAVRARLDRKIIQQIAAKDFYYQILDGLKELTAYDHSSALFIYDGAPPRFTRVAEQIAWRKAKSRRIGAAFPVPDEALALVGGGGVYGFARRDGGWREWTSHGAEPIARLLAAHDAPDGEDAPAAGSMLCAPLAVKDGPLGLIVLGARHAAALGAYEAEILESFAPLASLVIQQSQRTDSLRTKVVTAERKHAIADLARGVAHDINNALGETLPLVQQMREDVAHGTIDPDALAADLASVEGAVQVCRRIFGAMLSFARGSARAVGEGDVRLAIESTSGVLADSLRRQGVRLELALAEAMPAVSGRQSDLEQLFLNLATNAREAMPQGGVLSIATRVEGDVLQVSLRDTGVGIPAEDLARIEEPFFSTKPDGTGLGLPTCRAILSEMDGELQIESRPGVGTRVTLRFPAARAVPVTG